MLDSFTDVTIIFSNPNTLYYTLINRFYLLSYFYSIFIIVSSLQFTIRNKDKRSKATLLCKTNGSLEMLLQVNHQKTTTNQQQQMKWLLSWQD